VINQVSCHAENVMTATSVSTPVPVASYGPDAWREGAIEPEVDRLGSSLRVELQENGPVGEARTVMTTAADPPATRRIRASRCAPEDDPKHRTAAAGEGGWLT
jgi:hypothetical protein